MKFIVQARFLVIFAIGMISVSVVGCAWNSKVAPVSGVVLMNGSPLAHAMVEFQPIQGAPSYGYTDANGQYTLAYQLDEPGALIGTHTVRVTTAGEKTDLQTDRTVQVAESVPEKYNEQSELVVEVIPGKNVVDVTIEGQRSTKPRRRRSSR